jgi:multiple sugar transport system substrate-binding protein
MNIENSRRRFFKHGAVLGSALLLPSVAWQSSRAADPVRLRALWWGGQDRAKRTNEAIQLFEKQRSEFKVATESTAWGDYWTKVATLVAGGNAPDVIQMDYRYLVEYAKRGSLLALDPFMPKLLDIQDFGANNLDSCRVDNKLYGVNLGTNSTATIFDTAAFAKAGIPLPTHMWTWDDCSRMSQEITKSRGKGFWGCMDSGGGEPAFEVFARQQGKDLYTADGKLGVDADLTAAWLDYWHKLRKAGGCVPPELQALDKGSVDSAMLVLGKAAIDLRHSNFLEGFQLAHKEKLVVTMYPQTKGGRWGQYIKPSQMMSVAASTKNPEAAVQLANFLVKDPGATRLLSVERGVPASPAIRKLLLADLNDVGKAMVDYIALVTDKVSPLPPPPPSGGGEIQKLLRRLNEKVGFGQATPSVAAKEFVEESKRILG